MGDHVIVQRGRMADCTGVICRTCKYTGMLWLHLDKYKNHDYESVEFGPYFSSEFIPSGKPNINTGDWQQLTL